LKNTYVIAILCMYEQEKTVYVGIRQLTGYEVKKSRLAAVMFVVMLLYLLVGIVAGLLSERTDIGFCLVAEQCLCYVYTIYYFLGIRTTELGNV